MNAATAAIRHLTLADALLESSVACLRQRRDTWRVQWLKRAWLQRRANEHLAAAAEHVRIGDEYRAKAARLGR